MKHTLSLLALAALVMTGTAFANHEAAAEEQSLRAVRHCNAIRRYALDVIEMRDTGRTKAEALKNIEPYFANNPDFRGMTPEGQRFLEDITGEAYKDLRANQLDFAVWIHERCMKKFLPPQ